MLTGLLSIATIVDDVAFASLEALRKWMTSGARPKDLSDIKLIENT